jgi:cytosine/adenosine deaminase-related metal-dependent hydrolase
MLKSIHRAKFVLAGPDILLQNAAVHILDSGRIARVEAWDKRSAETEAEVVDWGSAVIMPGLINAHTHLELTSFLDQLTQFDSFTDWILQLINRRRSWTQEAFLASAKAGARLSLSSGTTLVGDITSSGVGWDATKGENLRRIVFEETVAFSPDQADQALSQLKLLLNTGDPDPLLTHGISPHAPYSVSPELFRHAAELARNRGLLLSTHVAETKAELQFLQLGTGEFRNLLSTLGVMPSGWKPPALSPIPYLESLRVLGPSCVLIHCNYLNDDSIARIRAARCSVVFCPRSHAFFGHEEHPVRKLLDFGINVALGTDSLASNSSLSMLDEVRALFQIRKDIKPEEIFRAATLSGAEAFRLGSSLGLLKPDYCADMTVLELPQAVEPRQLCEQILEGAGECLGTVVQGQIAWQKAGFA